MKKVVKKRKVRYDRILVLVIAIVLVAFSVSLGIQSLSKKNKKVENDTPRTEEKIDYQEALLALKNDDLNQEFLNWLVKTYGDDFLKKVYDAQKENGYSREMWHELTGNSYFVLKDLQEGIYQNNDRVQLIEGSKDEINISFAGDVSLADNWEIMPFYLSRQKGVYGILSEDTVKYMNDADIMIVNNEFCFSNRGTPMPKKTWTFRANPEHVSVYDEMGVDLVTLANNHIYDFGEEAFLDTLDTLEKANLPYIGAGRNIEEAMEPYYYIVNGYKIAFVNATRAEKFILTPEATEDSPGVFRAYDPEPYANLIKETKEHSDYVVALLHWGKEDSHVLEDVVLETGKLYIDSGADLIVGTHAHELQGVEFYKGKLIAYNLGDFIFSKETKPTGILTWKLSKDGTSSYYFVPAIQSDKKTSIVEGEEAKDIFEKMKSWSVNGEFKENGEIVENS